MELDELWEGDMAPAKVGDKSVLLINIDGEVRAYENRCPHQAWALDEGDFDGETLTCSRHSWEFDALSGRGVNPTNCQLTTYPCVVNDDGMICVDIS
jgi:toluene monooxygenase system ferredoxin subunit